MEPQHTAQALGARREFWLLCRLRCRLLRNGMVRRMRQHWGRWLALAVVAVLFLLGDYVFFTHLWKYLVNIPGGMGTILTTQLLNMVFLSFFSMLVFSNTVASLSTIYLSSDLLILM